MGSLYTAGTGRQSGGGSLRQRLAALTGKLAPAVLLVSIGGAVAWACIDPRKVSADRSLQEFRRAFQGDLRAFQNAGFRLAKFQAELGTMLHKFRMRAEAEDDRGRLSVIDAIERAISDVSSDEFNRRDPSGSGDAQPAVHDQPQRAPAKHNGAGGGGEQRGGSDHR